MTNYNRMTIRALGDVCSVFKMKRRTLGFATDMAANRAVWEVSRIAKPLFVGSYGDCLDFINNAGAEFMTEHGFPV